MSRKKGKDAEPADLPLLAADPNAAYCKRLAEETAKAKRRPNLDSSQGRISRLKSASPEDLKEKLKTDAKLQWDAAIETDYSPSKWLLEQELKARRRWDPATDRFLDEPCFPHEADDIPSGPPPDLPPNLLPEAPADPAGHEARDVYEIAAEQELTGLCFSGGGIRSATFNLGVLQGLAELGLLPFMDYLSSVSGGGYIHQFLAAWILRDSQGRVGVERKLIPRPEPGCPAPAPEPIKWLRRYASYLTPKRGILSTDTWTMIAIWFRNTVLNQTPIVSFLASAFFLLNLLAPEDARQLLRFSCPTAADRFGVLCVGLVIAIFVVISIVELGRDLHRQTQLSNLDRNPDTAHGQHETSEAREKRVAKLYETLLSSKKVQLRIILPWLAMSVWATFWQILPLDHGEVHLVRHLSLAVTFLGLVFTAGVVAFAGGGCESYRNLRDDTDLHEATVKLSFTGASILAALVACAMGFGFQVGSYHLAAKIYAKIHILYSAHSTIQIDPWRVQLVILPALLLCVPYVAIELTLGLLGRDYADTRREWLARLRAWSMLYCAVWMGVIGIVLLAPYLMYFIASKGAVVEIPAVAAFVLSHLTTLLAGSSSKSDGKPNNNGFLGYSLTDLVAMAAAPVAVFTFLVVLACVVECLAKLFLAPGHPGQWMIGLMLWAVVAVAIACLFGWRLDINEFSMQSFYRNRLSRCYLGATLWERKPNPFTGFDMRNRVQAVNARGQGTPPLVKNLVPDNFDQLGKPKGSYDGPFPIFCTTLNLTTGEDLASQERKGASFAFTPLYSGYNVSWTDARKKEAVSLNGYVPTAKYAYRDGGVHLDTAVAISGAAVNPNQGYNSNPALAFLMTFFNVRLGWWISNPRKTDAWKAKGNRPTPAFALWYLLRELFGSANDRSNYVNLSDGGHFENMGLYELVRRRCSYIIVCDAEEDPEMKFSGIGNAVNRCRADFGAEIDLDLRPLQIEDDGFSQAHCVVGTIRYPPPRQEPQPEGASRAPCPCLGETDEDRYTGTILYIKSSLVGDEPADLLAYKLQHPTFPQDSTANQWFTETQFESYRRLGHHIAMTAIRPALQPDRDRVKQRGEIARLFRNMYSIWYPPTPEMQKYLPQHMQQYNAILAELRQRPELAGLAERLNDERASLRSPVLWDAPDTPVQSKDYAWQFANALLDFMYTVYIDLDLAFPDNRTSPHADWWVCLFRRWCRVSLLQETWGRLEPIYTEEFRLFARRELMLP
jgi:hypothetical protein